MSSDRKHVSSPDGVLLQPEKNVGLGSLFQGRPLAHPPALVGKVRNGKGTEHPHDSENP